MQFKNLDGTNTLVVALLSICQYQAFFGRFSAIKTKSAWQNLEFSGKKLEFFLGICLSFSENSEKSVFSWQIIEFLNDLL